MGSYQAFYRQSIDAPDTFWTEEAKLIDWHKPFAQVCDTSRPPFAKWFVGGETNLCHNAVDRHAAVRPAAAALVYVSTETGREQIYSFAELKAEVMRMAAILQAQGIGRGDRVLIYMPMIPEAAFAMLACARIGAIHSVVFGGFAAASLATRVERRALMAIVAACFSEKQDCSAFFLIGHGFFFTTQPLLEWCLVGQYRPLEGSDRESDCFQAIPFRRRDFRECGIKKWLVAQRVRDLRVHQLAMDHERTLVIGLQTLKALFIYPDKRVCLFPDIFCSNIHPKRAESAGPKRIGDIGQVVHCQRPRALCIDLRTRIIRVFFTALARIAEADGTVSNSLEAPCSEPAFGYMAGGATIGLAEFLVVACQTYAGFKKQHFPKGNLCCVERVFYVLVWDFRQILAIRHDIFRNIARF